MRLALAIPMLVAACAISGQARAVTIGFDDLPGNVAAIPNGYAGLNWSNFFDLNADTFGPSGYANGVVSHPNVAFNAGGNPASFSSAKPITLTSAFFAGAWNDGLKISATAFSGSTVVDKRTFTVDTTGPTLEAFHWTGVTKVTFASSGGTNHGFSGTGTQFVMDDLTLAAASVAEPASILLAGVGLLGLGLARLRKAPHSAGEPRTAVPSTPAERMPYT